jgi:hypothetical protein
MVIKSLVEDQHVKLVALNVSSTVANTATSNQSFQDVLTQPLSLRKVQSHPKHSREALTAILDEALRIGEIVQWELNSDEVREKISQ